MRRPIFDKLFVSLVVLLSVVLSPCVLASEGEEAVVVENRVTAPSAPAWQTEAEASAKGRGLYFLFQRQ